MAGVGAEAAEAAKQLFVWQFAGQVIEALLGPSFELLTQAINSEQVPMQLDPATVAGAVAHGWIDFETGVAEAARSGLNKDKFGALVALATPRLTPGDLAEAVVRGFLTKDAADGMLPPTGLSPDNLATMVQLAGDAPAPDELAAALRRGIIPEDSGSPDAPGFIQGVQQGRLADKWVDMVKQMAVQWPSPTDALDAYLEGQIDEAKAKELYTKFGGDLQFFQMLYESRGTAPTPDMAGTMANRRIIEWDGTGPDSTSFQQAFLEGPWRNKWLGPMKQLMQYLPPPRTVTAMFHEGTLTKEQAVDLLTKTGLTPDLAAAYVTSGSAQKSANARDLTESQIVALYEAQLVSSDDAESMLEALKFDTQDAQYILSLADLRRAISALNTAVSRVHTLYVGHKISRPVVQDTLTKLGVPTGQVSDILAMWDLEAAVNVRLPTQAQIVDAWYLQIIDQATATTELVQMGYGAHDAWLLLSIKNKGPLPDEPPKTPTPIGTAGG